MKKKLIICLDFDGVIAHAGELKRAVASELLARKIKLSEISNERVRAGKSSLSEEELDRVKSMVYYDKKTTERLKPVPHSISTIKKWLRSGHTVKVITARPGENHKNAIVWLKKHGIEIPVISAGIRQSKVKYLKEGCDVFVDDDLDRVREAKEVVGQALFFKWPYNDGERGIKNVTSLKDIRIKV